MLVQIKLHIKKISKMTNSKKGIITTSSVSSSPSKSDSSLPQEIMEQNLHLKKINMKRFNIKTILPLLFIAVSFSSCQAIADIFKAGVWFGVIGVVVIIVIIFWLISRAGKK